MTTKRTIVALLLAVCMLLIAACSSPSPSADPTAAPEATAAPAATEAPADDDDGGEDEGGEEPAAAEKVALKMYFLPQDDASDASKEGFEFTKAKIEEKFPNFEIEWTRLAPGTDYRQQYDQLLMAGDGPTFWRSFPYVDVQTRLANGTIAELTEYMADWDLRAQGKVTTIFDDAISTADGKWYAVPWGAYVNGVVYNSEVITEAGGDPTDIPTTWSDFADKAQQYTDKTLPRFGYTVLGSDYNAWTYTPWVWSAGGEMVRDNGDGTWAIAFNEDPGVEAALFMNELIWARDAAQKDVLQTYDDFLNHFRAGQVCYGWGSPTGFSADDLAKFDQKQENVGFFPLPGKDEGGRVVAFAGGEVWTVSPNATQEQKDAAWQWILYESYDEEFLLPKWEDDNRLGQLDSRPAARNDLVETKYSMASAWPSHWAAEFTAANEVALPEPYCPNWNQLKDEIVIPLQTIYLTEGITFDEAKQLLDDCAEQLYTKYPEAFKKP